MSSSKPTGAVPEGRRERKRRQTRERIEEAARTLFLERGFDATTIDDIAAAADISKRSFFDYFPSKEELVSAWQDSFGAVLAAAVIARPAEEPLARVVEAAMTSSIAQATSPQSIALAQLIRDTPALRARDHLKYARLEQTLTEALSARAGSDAAARVGIRLLAMIVVGTLRVGGELWHERPTTEAPADYAGTIFRQVWTALGELGLMAEEHRRPKA